MRVEARILIAEEREGVVLGEIHVPATQPALPAICCQRCGLHPVALSSSGCEPDSCRGDWSTGGFRVTMVEPHRRCDPSRRSSTVSRSQHLNRLCHRSTFARAVMTVCQRLRANTAADTTRALLRGACGHETRRMQEVGGGPAHALVDEGGGLDTLHGHRKPQPPVLQQRAPHAHRHHRGVALDHLRPMEGSARLPGGQGDVVANLSKTKELKRRYGAQRESTSALEPPRVSMSNYPARPSQNSTTGTSHTAGWAV